MRRDRRKIDGKIEPTSSHKKKGKGRKKKSAEWGVGLFCTSFDGEVVDMVDIIVGPGRVSARSFRCPFQKKMKGVLRFTVLFRECGFGDSSFYAFPLDASLRTPYVRRC